MDAITTEQKVSGAKAIAAVGTAIKELGTVPSGELYTRLMSYVSINVYNKIIGILENVGAITVDSQNVITWIG